MTGREPPARNDQLAEGRALDLGQADELPARDARPIDQHADEKASPDHEARKLPVDISGRAG